MSNFSPHIPFSELADFVDRRSTLAAESLQHLDQCSRCAGELQTIRQTTSLMSTDALENAPAELVQHAKTIFRERAASQQPALLQRVVASLTFDSLTAAPAFGLRSQTSGVRQLLYSTETIDIDLRIATDDEAWQVAGQLPGSLSMSGDVSLAGENFSATAKLNELSEFSFNAVPEGSYKISVHLPELIVETPHFELGP
jgi:hypothetical protein